MAKWAVPFWEAEIPILQALPKPKAQKQAPKNWFLENLHIPGQSQLSSKGKSAYPPPTFPKTGEGDTTPHTTRA